MERRASWTDTPRGRTAQAYCPGLGAVEDERPRRIPSVRGFRDDGRADAVAERFRRTGLQGFLAGYGIAANNIGL